MLKGISPILTADVLYALAAMGHGDYIAVVDSNFPAQSIARHCVVPKVAQMGATSLPRALSAILRVMPLESAGRMEVMGAPSEIPPVQEECLSVIKRLAPGVEGMHGVERFAFYDSAKHAFAVIQTGERRFYGCVLLTKGVIPPAATPSSQKETSH